MSTCPQKIDHTEQSKLGVERGVQKPRFLVDVDDVLASLKPVLLEHLDVSLGVKINLEELEVWDLLAELDPEHRRHVENEMAQPGFCWSLSPIPGAQEAIREIRDHAEIVVVTSPHHSPTWAYERVRWLGHHFEIPMSTIVLTPAKHVVKGDFLLDDNPHNIEAWQAAHPDGEGLLWATPNTDRLSQYDRFRIQTWDQVIDRVKRFMPK